MHDIMMQNFFVVGDVEQHVCPVINDLASQESIDDFRTEAVAVSICWFHPDEMFIKL